METKKVTIEVTKNDVRYGRKEDGEMCMVARAINRTIKRGYRATVAEYIGISKTLEFTETEVFATSTPRAVKRKMYAFDTQPKSKSTPFKFPLRLPVELIRTKK